VGYNRQKYSLNESVFSVIDTEEKAYWLGFLLADGCVYNNPRHVVRVCIKGEDTSHVSKFLNFVGSNTPVKSYLAAKKYPTAEVAFTSKNMVSDLIKHGVGPRKSLTCVLPTVDKTLERHLIRGIWDGDGTVLFRAPKSIYPNTLKPETQLCGNLNIITAVQDILVNEVGVSRTTIHPVARIYLFRHVGQHSRSILNYLYKDCTVALERKLQKAQLGMDWAPKIQYSANGQLKHMHKVG
jgi:hypothetical protein